MPKVLIIGPDYFNFLPAVEKAFTRLGWEASVAAYDNPIHPYTVWMKWRYKLSCHRDRLQARSRAAFDVEVRARFIGGDGFDPAAVSPQAAEFRDEHGG